jgi:hypothetical protein
VSYNVCHCTHDKATHHAGKDNCLAHHCECKRYADQSGPKLALYKASDVEMTIAGVDFADGEDRMVLTLADLNVAVKTLEDANPPSDDGCYHVRTGVRQEAPPDYVQMHHAIFPDAVYGRLDGGSDVPLRILADQQRERFMRSSLYGKPKLVEAIETDAELRERVYKAGVRAGHQLGKKVLGSCLVCGRAQGAVLTETGVCKDCVHELSKNPVGPVHAAAIGLLEAIERRDKGDKPR